MAKIFFGFGNKKKNPFEQMTEEELKKIMKLFEEAKKDLSKKVKKMGNTKSDRLQKIMLNDAIESLNGNIKELYEKLEGQIDSAMLDVCKKSIEAEQQYFRLNFGLQFGKSYMSIPTSVVNDIRNGKIYNKQWYLSDAIWRDQKSKLDEINAIIGTGVAEGRSTYDIAKDLEKYVDPRAKKDWAWSKVYPGTAKRIDYNAQRLARTAISHAYEQCTVQQAKNNPLSQGIEWISAMGERTCQICQDRDGKIYQPDELPLDHPNGLCTYAVVLPDMDDIASRLGAWVAGNPDYALDEWYSNLGGEK